MKNVSLLKAAPKDIPTIYELAEKIWMIHYVPIIGMDQVIYMLGTMYNEASLRDQMTTKSHDFYLIITHNKPIGFISVSGTDDLFIHKFYIDPSSQSIGLGTTIINLLIDQFHPKTMHLTVNRKNYKSINFYFKNGFVIEKVADFDIGNEMYMNDFVMRWNQK